MKTLITIISLLTSLAQTNANASPFTKSCEDYNQDSVEFLDKLLPQGGSSLNQEQNLVVAHYQGSTDDKKACQVKISRVVREECGITSLRYHVAITVDSQAPQEKDCAGALTMDVDLKVNSETYVEYKNTYVYPQIFSSDYNKIAGQLDSAGVKFSCRSYIKDRPGYRVGQDRRNHCHLP